MLLELFENVKIYGRYVKTNGLDEFEYWNKIKEFLNKPEQKKGLENINCILLKKKELSNGDADNKKVNLNELLELAYNLGQKSIEAKSNDIKIQDLITNTYIILNQEENNQIRTDIQIQDLITNLNNHIISLMNVIQTGGTGDYEPFYSENIDELTIANEDYRRVIYTGPNQQFVLMSIEPKDDIKMEIHKEHDQFIRIEQGEGKAIIGKTEYNLKDDTGLIIPAGMPHQIINTSSTKKLKLYTIYSPKEHPEGLVQSTNPDKQEIESEQETNSDSQTKSEIKSDSEPKVIPDIKKVITDTKNVINDLKKVMEDSKEQVGGFDDKYYLKYLKYRTKYYSLKKYTK